MRNLIFLSLLFANAAFAQKEMPDCATQLSRAVLHQDPRAFFGGDCEAKNIQVKTEDANSVSGSIDVVCDDDDSDTYGFYLQKASCAALFTRDSEDSLESPPVDDHNGCFKHPGNHCK